MSATNYALDAARHYLRFVLGGRRGCRVLEGLEKGDAQEIIEECAEAFEKFAASKGWQKIETAPMDGTEILVYREDAGVLLARWIAPGDFLTARELEDMPNADEPDWFMADFVTGERLSNSGLPTHWMALPEPPKP